jgi:hypothetical protein
MYRHRVIFSGVFLTILLLMATPVQALITVANTSDSGAGSLRQAIADAASGEEIQFGVTGTITLTSGELTIGKNLTITGPGSGSLSIDGNNASRVFYINSSTVTVNMSGITVTNGNSANWGGGIENEGTLNLSDCVISGCSANGAGNGYGGGLDNYQGTVTVTGCTISGNSSTTDGGGLATYGGSITLTECTVSGNSSDNGAGISNSSNAGGTIDVIRCTVYNNNATAGSNNYGGGIFCNGGTLNLTNSTISGNSAVSGGGGIIDGAAATITITQCTIVDNTSTSGGGGIELGSSTANIKNTILANNTGGGGNNFYSDGGALNSQGYNLENNTEAGFTAGGDIQNGTIDLDPIGDNGGPTQTHALQYSSDAIDAIPEGGTGYNGAPATDQRGTARPQSTNVDIGAFELEQAPQVTTQAVTGIGPTSATGNGTITSLGSPNPTAHGMVWNTSGTPTLADNSSDEGAASATGAFTSNMTGLSPYTTYYVRAYATNANGTSYGNEVSFATSGILPTVTTQAVSGIGTTTATGSGTITSLGVPNPTAHGMVWNTTGSPTLADSSSNEGPASATGAFTSNMTGLSPNTTYYVRAYATNAQGTAYGNEVNFTTAPQAPTVTTQAVTGIGTTTATGNGNITSLGVPNPTAHGMVWNIGGNPTLADSSSNEGPASATGAFTSNMTGLSPNTTYYVRAYATNTAGTAYGNEVSFTTNAQLPTVTTQAVTGIGTTTATGNGTITSLGAPNPFAHGMVWNTGGNPTLADSSSNEGAAAATGAFTSSMTGLSPNTTYYVRAYATNTAGTAYGNEVSFTTNAQLPTVTTQAVTGIGTTTATGNGTITDLGVPNPFAHGVCWNTGGNPTLADSSTDEGAASATGAFTSNMTGLSPYTTYYVRAYATNTGGTAYGNQVSFTTNAQLPTVTTQAVSGIGTTTATGNGNITSLGAPNPTAHGMVWNTTGSPTLADSSTNEGAASATGAFTSNMTGLSPFTTYYVRAYATNTAGTAYGNQVSFTTNAQLPTVTTQAVTGIGTTTATGNGTITDLGVPNPFAHGVCWNTGGNPTLADSSTDEGAASATGAFTSNMTGLSPYTTYYVRAYATNTGGTAYGNQVSFTASAQLPTVTTQAVTDITATTATGSGIITDLGVPDPTAHGVCWNAAGNPTVAGDHTDEGPIGATGAFTSSMTGLSPYTTYYVRAYATNTAGTVYGSQVSFTTPRQEVVISGHITTDSGEPLADVLLTFSNSGGSAVSDHRGYYSRRLRQNWSGTVTPSREGYRFEPESRSYTNVDTDQRNQDYQALPLTPLTVTITHPADGDTVYGTVPVEAQVPAEAAVSSVEFFADGQPIGSGVPLMGVEPVIEFDFSAALLLFITPDRQLAKLDRLGSVSPVCRTPVNVKEILWDTNRHLLVVLDMPQLLNDNHWYRVLRVDARTGLYRGVTQPEPLLSRLKREDNHRRHRVLQAELLPSPVVPDQLDVRPDGLLAWGNRDERDGGYWVGRLDPDRSAAVEPLMFRLAFPVHGLRAFPAQWWSGPPTTGETVTYRLDWDTAAYGNGSHELKAAAYDTAGGTVEDRIDVIVANISLLLSALRKTERAWIIARDYGQLDILVDNPAQAAGFVIYRQTGSGAYQAIKQFGPAELVDGSYTFNDQFLDKQQSYTYRVEAVDAAGMVMGVSNEVTI